MAVGKEIRTKIKSVENTKKITKAMEMVAASKMRKAQDRMRASRPYSEKIVDLIGHFSQSNPEYRHPFMNDFPDAPNIGIIVISTDKGLCGGLNTNVFRHVLAKVQEAESKGKKVKAVAIGNKALSFLSRIDVEVLSTFVQVGDSPLPENVNAAIKPILELYEKGQLEQVFIFSNKFINTMKQDPVTEVLLPLNSKDINPINNYNWDYVYEPESYELIDGLVLRYVETITHQALVENIASEQSARMVAMKAATDNAGNVIEELKLVYNKTRQAAITKELSEIVAGAAAV
jgi:F-type H+-transporting ATPase subunit gamma